MWYVGKCVQCWFDVFVSCFQLDDGYYVQFECCWIDLCVVVCDDVVFFELFDVF